MADKTIGNPGGLWGATADTQLQEVADVVNNSGGTLLPGDVVIIDKTGTLATTTTTPSDQHVVGVVLPVDRGTRTVGSTETVASGAVMPVCVRGPARIRIAANVVVDGDPLATSAVAKVAAKPADAANVGALQALSGSFIAVAMEATAAKDANNTILAYIQKM